ncbi:MAG: GxxExxY protein [Candidatus Jorgensenbacteria bacterium]
MHTNTTNKIIYPELSYALTGVSFSVHNQLGRFSRERQYGDAVEAKLKELKIPYEREYNVKGSGNIIDFLVDSKIVMELKAKPVVSRDDYYQVQRYLQTLNLKLGIIVNFQNRYIKPTRVVRIDTPSKARFV